MKRIIYLSLLSFTAFVLFSYSNGSFTADYTGSTGLGQGCAQIGCHTGAGTMGVDTNKLIVRVLDGSNNDVNSYTLGQQYNIEVKFKLHGASKIGFQCTNLFYFSNVKAGSIGNTTMPSLVQVFTDGSGREYASHTAAGNGAAVINGAYAIWKYKWTAPSVASAAISFNCAVNRTNSDGSENGDSIFLFIKTLQLPTSLDEVSVSNQIKIYPNPCQNFISVTSENSEIEEIRILDLKGSLKLQPQLNTKQRIDLSKLNTGNYILLAKTSKGNYTQFFSKE